MASFSFLAAQGQPNQRGLWSGRWESKPTSEAREASDARRSGTFCCKFCFALSLLTSVLTTMVHSGHLSQSRSGEVASGTAESSRRLRATSPTAPFRKFISQVERCFLAAQPFRNRPFQQNQHRLQARHRELV